VVVGPGDHWWVEPASAPLTAEGFSAGLGAKLVRDDLLFAALQTSLGSLGIVAGVVFRCVPNFWLDLERDGVGGGLPGSRLLTADLIARLSRWEFAALVGQPERRIWHFDAVFNPFTPQSQCYLSAYLLADQPARGTPADVTGEHRGDEYNPDLLQFASRLSAAVPGLPGVVTSVGLQSEYAKPVRGTPRVWGGWFAQQDLPGGALGASIGVACQRLPAALPAIMETVRRAAAVPCVVATRFIPASGALLAMNIFERTCMIDMDGANLPAMADLVAESCRRLEQDGIPFTMHWGKWIGFLTRDHVEAVYGDRLSSWRAARARLLPSAELARTFSNAVVDALL
jgi:hypothetical protein